MIQPNELRIGNYIACHYTSLERQVNVDDFRLIDGYIRAYEYFQPIPLTEEWLLKFGFTLGGSIDKFVLKLNEQMFQYKSNGNIRLWGEESQTEGQAFETKNIQFVHQLQNLHFALTGEELKVKEMA